MDDSLVLKNRLKEYRKELDLSQDELAKMDKELLNPSQDNPWPKGQIAS